MKIMKNVIKVLLGISVLAITLFAGDVKAKAEQTELTPVCLELHEGCEDVIVIMSAADVKLQYSRDGESWENVENLERDGFGITLASDNRKVYLKARTDTEFNVYGYSINFIGNGEIDVSGDIMSLLNPAEDAPKMGTNAFESLFMYDDDSASIGFTAPIVDASGLVLPDILVEGCYKNMFLKCTSLEAAPEFTVNEMAPYCYNYMFFGCTSLEEAPKLTVNNAAPYCCYGMFMDCISLEDVSRIKLNDTDLSNAEHCYGFMFRKTGITKAPDLPATNLSEGCYINMFRDCSDLVEAPKLLAVGIYDTIGQTGHCLTSTFYGTKISEITVYFDKVPKGDDYNDPHNPFAANEDPTWLPEGVEGVIYISQALFDNAQREASGDVRRYLRLPESWTYEVKELGFDNGGSGNNDEANENYSCDHNYVWQIITSPTATTFGTEGYVCSKCGATKDVREMSPISQWALNQIANAKPGDVLTMDFGPWNSYPLWMMQMIADKPTVTYVFKYTYQGNKYEVTIKPGDKFALDCDWYGPAKMPTLFDTVITKW